MRKRKYFKISTHLDWKLLRKISNLTDKKNYIWLVYDPDTQLIVGCTDRNGLQHCKRKYPNSVELI